MKPDFQPADRMFATPIVETTHLTRVFRLGDVEVNALKGVSLSVAAGEFTAVAGPSGSGKTTLFNLIGGLDLPTEGEVRVGEQLLSSMKPRELARLRLEKIGFVFQAYNLIPVLTVYENVEYPLILKGVSPERRKERVTELLASVGLEGMIHRKPMQMSGGQQQRVAIARSLVCEPLVVLADEPTANIDSETGAALLSLMRRLNREKHTTFLFSTHDPMVMRSARRLVRLKDGLIVSDEQQNGEA